MAAEAAAIKCPVSYAPQSALLRLLPLICLQMSIMTLGRMPSWRLRPPSLRRRG